MPCREPPPPARPRRPPLRVVIGGWRVLALLVATGACAGCRLWAFVRSL